MLAIGLMSGTSLDGIDAALVRIQPKASAYAIELERFATFPFDPELAARIRGALPPNAGSVREVAVLHRRIGLAFAAAARAVAGDARIDYVASHGMTLWHDGAAQTTLQLGDAFVIRESVGATVCYDFRSGDCASGGHGAPLVPYVDALWLTDAREDRVALNLGGIANLTALPHGIGLDHVVAFDTGPGNMLIDGFVRERTNGRQSFDVDGALAARGAVDERALEAFLQHPYFAQSAPKSAGREEFGAAFLAQHAAMVSGMSLEDGVATLTELTAATVGRAIDELALSRARVLVSGGGAHNRALMRRLQERHPEGQVESLASLGIDTDAKEAIAFVVLGYETLRGRAANLPSVTGASHPAVLGAIAPHELTSLLAEVQRECQRSS